MRWARARRGQIDFRFGARGVGDVAFAQAHFLRARGREVVGVPNELLDGERVSSTRIRAALAAGDIAAVRPVAGDAVRRARQRRLRCGTRATIWAFRRRTFAPDKMLPPDGVYAITGPHDGRDYPGLVSIGTNPTFDGQRAHGRGVAARLHGSMYGEEWCYATSASCATSAAYSVGELLAQMRRDLQAVGYPSYG